MAALRSELPVITTRSLDVIHFILHNSAKLTNISENAHYLVNAIHNINLRKRVNSVPIHIVKGIILCFQSYKVSYSIYRNINEHLCVF